MAKKEKSKEEAKKKEEKQKEKKEEAEEEIEETEETIDEKFEETTKISLEDLTETPQTETFEADNFSEFMLPSPSEEMPTFTLPPSTTEPFTEPENLEQSAASSIGTPMPTPTPAIRREDYLIIDNEPSYTAGTSEETILKNIEERGMMARTQEQIRHMQPRVMIEEWPEIEEAKERSRETLREYVIVEAERREEPTRGLPFEQQRKYRELKRKR